VPGGLSVPLRADGDPDRLAKAVFDGSGPSQPVVALHSTSAPNPAAPTGVAPLPSAPQAVALQIAAQMQARPPEPGQPLELTLDPPELGRLRLSIGDVGGTVTLILTAERSETVELMRRHLHLLAEELARTGVEAPQVQISRDDSRSASKDDRPSPDTHADPEKPPADMAAPPSSRLPLATPSARDGLDLRL
jgi:flagellar hook-length control protein FliK